MKLRSFISLLAFISSVFSAPEPRQPHIGSLYPLNKTDDAVSIRQNVQQPWAGAVQEGEGWSYVSGTIKVPHITGQPSNYAVSAWVGIDGMNCRNAILQTGIDLLGDGTIQPWYQWWPAHSAEFSPSLHISAGDTIRITVNAWTATSGNATLENLTTGQMVHQKFYNQAALCGEDAEWVLEDYVDYSSGQNVPVVDFGEIEILNAWAWGNNGWSNAYGANIVNLEIDGRQRSNCGSNANGVWCNYLS